MKIAVIGAGAIGCVVAGLLKKAGEDIVLIGRKDQVDTINKNGLKISGIVNDNVSIKALTKLDQEYDLVIFTTKTQDLEFAYQHNNDFLENCYVLTSQNGVQADNILSSHFYQDKQLSSIVMFGATYTKSGEVVYNFPGNWIVGSPFTPVNPTTHRIADVFKKAFDVVVSNNITGMKWTKVFVNFNNCIPAVLGKSMQKTFSDMDLCRLSVLLLREGVDIVQKS